MPEASQTDGRRLHYGHFYGILPVPADAPLAVVVGNCQAESLRIMLEGPDLGTVRIPPVFELTADDLPHLARLLARTQVLVSQPVRDDYHGLPIGTAQLAALLPPGARVVRVPVVRFAGLYPFHVIVRPPFDASLVPPLVEYHDLRTVVRAWRAARGLGAVGGLDAAGESSSAPDAAANALSRIRKIAAQSIAELQKRERHHDTVIVSDLFAHPTFDLMRTINHPGNTVWSTAAARVRARLGLPEHPVDPGRELLNSVHAPREPLVIEAFGLDEEPRPEWIVGDRRLDTADVERAHLEWYAEHPTVVDAAIARHAGALDTLGLLAAVSRAPGAERAASSAGGTASSSTTGRPVAVAPAVSGAVAAAPAVSGAVAAAPAVSGAVAAAPAVSGLAVSGLAVSSPAAAAPAAVTAPPGSEPAVPGPAVSAHLAAGTTALPRQLVIGSTRHAVSACAEALAAATSAEAARAPAGAGAEAGAGAGAGRIVAVADGDAAQGAVLRVPDLSGVVEAAAGIQNLHVHFTDRLFGSTPEAAADLFVALAAGRRVTVTLHDLPQPSDGERNLPRRAAAYARVAESAVAVACNSRHEALLLAEHTRPRLGSEVEVIPLPVSPIVSPPGSGPAAAAPLPTLAALLPAATTSLPTPAAPQPASAASLTPHAAATSPSTTGRPHASSARQPQRREVAILGYFYPGKGHAEVIAAVAERRVGSGENTPHSGARDPHDLAEVGLGDLAVVALGAAAPGHEAELAELAADAAALGVGFEATGYLDDAALLERCRSAAVPIAAHQHLSASASINTWIAAGRRPLLPRGRYTCEMAELRPGTVTLCEPDQITDALEHALAQPGSTWIDPGTSIRPDLADTAERYLAWWGSL